MKITSPLILFLFVALACSDPETSVSPDGSVADQGITADTAPADQGGGITAACAASKALLARVDAARMLKDLNYLEGLGERYSHANQVKVAAWLVAELKKLSGVTVSEHTYTHGGNKYSNVVADIPGTTKKDDWLLMGAHYDSTSSDPKNAPGADDNASGTAAVLEVARAMAGCKPARSLRLLFFSQEEKGTIGSQAYVRDMKATLPSNRMRGYINVDTIGYGPADEDLDVATRTKYKTLADNMASAVEKWTKLKVNKIVSDHCG